MVVENQGRQELQKIRLRRALTVLNPALHESLRKGGYLTRDARVAEPMKPGQPGARKKIPIQSSLIYSQVTFSLHHLTRHGINKYYVL